MRKFLASLLFRQQLRILCLHIINHKIINTNQNIKATYVDGILKLHLEKKEDVAEIPKKTIEVV